MTQLATAFAKMQVVSGWVEQPVMRSSAPGDPGRRFKHSDGFTARELVVGKGRVVGILVFDPNGARLGMVRSEQELP